MAALCLVLYRLSWPMRLFEYEEKWGHSDTWISIVFTDTVIFWAQRYHTIIEWCPLVTYEKMKEYAAAIQQFESITNGKLWGFIDGTFTGFSRPIKNQRIVYSGHKKHHGFKYQAIVTPDGLVISLHGPYEGKANDAAMVHDSKIEHHISSILAGKEDNDLYLFGDSAYTSFRRIMRPYPEATAAPEDKHFNLIISGVRIAVEQAFGLTKNNWALNAYDNALKSGLQPVAAYFEVSILFTNLLTCLVGRTAVNSRFKIQPPSAEEYLKSGDTGQ